MVLPQLPAAVPAADIDSLQIIMDQLLRSTPSTGLLAILVAAWYFFNKKKRPGGK